MTTDSPITVDFIAKLGGSAITNKSGFESINQETLDEAASDLARCYKDGLRFIVLHGAGSFGHRIAKEYGVAIGYNKHESGEKRESVKLGFAATRVSVTKLNNLVINSLVRLGLPAVAYTVFGTWRLDAGVVVMDNMNAVHHGLQQGFIPVLFGDCVFDDTNGSAILSSDVTIKHLSRRFRPKRAVFLMDCPGVFTLPPNMPEAGLIANIYVTKDGRALNGPTSTTDKDSDKVADVTGGIALKIDKACQIAVTDGGGIPVFLCSRTLDAFFSVCRFGDFCDARGTCISYRDDESAGSDEKE